MMIECVASESIDVVVVVVDDDPYTHNVSLAFLTLILSSLPSALLRDAT